VVIVSSGTLHFVITSECTVLLLVVICCGRMGCRNLARSWSGLRRGSAASCLLGLRVRIPPWGHGYLSLVSVVCCQAEISATSWSLVQRSPTECGVSNVCDRETSKNEAA
jgi:hypothetical protein